MKIANSSALAALTFRLIHNLLEVLALELNPTHSSVAHIVHHPLLNDVLSARVLKNTIWHLAALVDQSDAE